ncbi:UDP-N-acetylenolpyruvoylglucosamine reductase MurB [Botrimarina colliarenosi]|uniref:UDP-N-acetylenolpyruvoylglucosamine reductase n=1 Tax=Botrimarina colliarenosi TaxID=2528001 RepID=A0A5C6A9S5_9BACT|nr:UDP-N-acetylmuramate dehydrogenase [Botrimarina colliarenosi]TWT96107.1 UDP-N-acetylenolpyruvoylglucosamine reductase MurB [Botrimarina colliarenosi]
MPELNAGLESIFVPSAALADRTWLRVGGPADWLVRPTNVDELGTVIGRCRDASAPTRVLGGGSNVLVRDEGVRGAVLQLDHEAFGGVRIEGTRAIVGGGASLAAVINETVRAGLAGLDTLVGIPGTVGAALHHNAGGRGGDIGQWVVEATVMTRTAETITRSRDEMVFGYRQSSLDELAILEVVFELDPADPSELTKRMQKQWIVSKAAQPLSHERRGQVFLNPRGMSAGMLIDQAGLKGSSVGGATVSDKHANFFVAAEGATAADLLKLIDLVRSRIDERMGIELELAIEIW